MIINFSQLLNSIAEILTSGLTSHIHLTILASFLFSLITSPSLTGEVSLHCKLHYVHKWDVTYCLFPREKPLVKKRNEYLYCLHPFLVPAKTQSNAPPPTPIMSPRSNKLLHNFKRLTIWYYAWALIGLFLSSRKNNI